MVENGAHARRRASRFRLGAALAVLTIAATGLTACLTTPGDVGGTARNTDGSALSGIAVTLYAADDTIVDTTVTDGSGGYSFADVGPGYSFKLGLHDGSGTYLDWWHAGASGLATATPIAIGNGATTTIDATMVDPPSAASITGIVTDGITTDPIEALPVALVAPGTGAVLAVASTNDDGAYAISGLTPGSYVVRFGPSRFNTYGPTYNGGARSLGTALPVSLGAGATIAVGATPSPAGAIRGTVQTTAGDGASNSAVAGVRVLAAVREDREHPVATATTGADGWFDLYPVPAGEYVLTFVDPEGLGGIRGYAPATFGTRGVVDPVAATGVVVDAGEPTGVSAPQLAGADCTTARFPGGGTAATVSGLDLSGQRLAGCSFGVGGGASGTDLSGADLQRSWGGLGDFTDANLSGARLVGSSFGGMTFLRTDFSDADLRFVQFGVNFGSTFYQTDFSGADLTGATFGGLVPDQAIWSDTVCPDGINSDNVGGTCVGHGVG